MLRASSHSTAGRDWPKALTDDQARSLQILHSLQGYHEVLLHGVTGSGKTEVYLQAIAPLLKAQRSALVLVPEIGLTPQLTDRFRSRFGDKVRVYHSGLSEGERYDTWRQMLTGTPQVIIGTRSAVFAPLPELCRYPSCSSSKIIMPSFGNGAKTAERVPIITCGVPVSICRQVS